MKPKSSIALFRTLLRSTSGVGSIHRSALATLLVALGATLTAQATTYYWDVDGTTAGFGGPLSGTWGTSAFWSNNAAGNVATTNATITANDDLFLSSTGTANGALAISAGTKFASSITNGSLGNTKTISSGGGSITIGGTGANSGFFNTQNSAFTIAADVILAKSIKVQKTGNSNLSLSGNISGNGSMTLNNNNSNGGVINLSGATINNVGSITNSGTGTQAVTISGAIGTSVTGVIQNSATSQLNLTGVNLYTGATTVNAGRLNLGNNTANGSLASNTLVLGGGEFFYNRTGTVTQAFASGTTLNAGASAITANAAGGTINLNGLTRNAGSTVNFSGAGVVQTSTANTADSILGGWATFGGNGWATKSGSNVVALASYTDDTWGSLDNATVTQSTSQLANSTTNSLRFNNAGANTVTLDGANTINSGGLLVTSAVGANLSTITGGSLAGSAGGELVVIQNNTTGGLTIDSTIANNSSVTGLTKTGAGLLTLTGTNTYSGATYLNSGILNANSASALGDGSATNDLVFNGGTLQAGGTISSGRDVTLAKNGIIDANGNAVTLSGTISGAGGITNSGTTGSLTLGGENTYTGQTVIAANSTLKLNHASALGSSFSTSMATTTGSTQVYVTDGSKVVVGQAVTGTGIASGTRVASISDNLVTLNIAATATGTNSGTFAGSTSIAAGGTLDLNGFSISERIGFGNNTVLGSIINNTGTKSFVTAEVDGGTGDYSIGGSGDIDFVRITGTNGMDITKIGSGTVTLSGAEDNVNNRMVVAEGTLVLAKDSTAANAAIGRGLTINTGATAKLAGTGGNQIQNTFVTIDGTFDMNDRNETISYFTGASTGKITNTGSGTSILTTAEAGAGVRTYNGIIQDGTGKVAFIKAGSATMELTGANTYSGSTTINGGTLVLSDSLAIQNSALDTTNSTTGGSAVGLKTTVTTLTIGGLTGNKDLGTLFTTTSGGGDTVTALTLNTGIGVNHTYSGAIADGAAGMTLTKTGAGTQTLTGTNGYTGATTVSDGELVIAGAGSINGSNEVTVEDGATFRYNSSTNLTAELTLNSGATVAGTNLSGVAFTVGAGVTLSPGNSPGTMATGDLTWSNGGHYNWQVLDVDDAAGIGYDTTAVTGTLALGGLTAGGFSINLWTLASIGPDVSGDALNFNDLSNYQWTLASATDGVTGFNAANFSIFTGANNGAQGFDNAFTGSFNVSADTNSIYLNYVAVPEPAAALLGGLGLLTLLRRRRNS